jgi:hypothetical protein
MDSTDPATRFRNKSVQKNMDFIPASEFSRDAEIGTRGYGRPPEGRSRHEFVIAVDTNVQNYSRDGEYYFASPKAGIRSEEFTRIAAEHFPKGMSQAMTWIARGYRKTGKDLIINNTRYEYAEASGAFGYLAGHAGEVREWRQDLRGNELRKLDNDSYHSGCAR